MFTLSSKLFFIIIFFLTVNVYGKNDNNNRIYPFDPVPFNNIEIKDDFWSERIKTNHEVTIPVSIHQSDITGRIKNFKIAGGLAEGDFQSDYPFDDSDIFKIIEGGSYSLEMFPDPELEEKVDSLIWLIGEAQEDDGYLYTHLTIEGPYSHPWIGERWEKTHDLSHELYNMGHMYEAAVAHYQLTGRRDFLDIAIKNADLILEEIGPDKFETYPGHQEIEIGLVKLYRVTGNEDYLDQAKYFLDARGHEDIGEPGEYDQSHKPVTEQNEAVGHAVRALYMYSGMADVAAMTGEEEYISAIDHLWENVVHSKLYVTGGVGSGETPEGFGPDYSLPNRAYCETCAGIANVFWNHRMFLHHGDAKYIDVLERTLYNNVLSGVALTGDEFFYPNPLVSHGDDSRSEWFGCACCPANINRFIPSVPGYIYAQRDNDLYVNLYVSSETSFELDNNSVDLTQTSDLPWAGNVELEIQPEEASQFKIKARIPGWADNNAVPGDLYSFINETEDDIQIRVNGELIEPAREKGYAIIDRNWQQGDIVEINFPMEIMSIESHPEVEANIDRVALQRGPLVYAAEWPEFEDESVLDIILDPGTPLSAEFDSELLHGMTVLEGMAKGSKRDEDGEVETFDKPFTAIPYYAWAHRGEGEMAVWLATNIEAASPQQFDYEFGEVSHDYKEDGVEETIWDGLKVNEGVVPAPHPEDDLPEAEIIELIENKEGEFKYTTTKSWWDNDYDNGVLLYQEVPADSDFEAIVKIRMGDFPSFGAGPVNFLSGGLQARVPTDAEPEPEAPKFINVVAFDRDGWGAVHGVRDVYGGTEDELWNSDHSIADYPWMKLTREDEVYTAHFSDDGENWIVLDGVPPVERPDMAGYNLQVGLFHGTYSEEVGTIIFSDFSLKTEEDLSVQPIEQDEDIKVHYRPKEEAVVLLNKNNLDINSIKVFSIDGKLVRNIATATNNNEIRISSLDIGIYIIVAESAGKQYSNKVIVH